MARAIDKRIMFDLIIEAKKTDPETGPFSEWLAEYLVDHLPTIIQQNGPSLLEFDVVDTTTGKYPDWERIAREESWAKGLVYCDMDGIAIREDGSLILLDECGNCVSCPPDRFEIRRCPPEGEVNA